MMSSSSPSLQEPTTSQTEPRKLPPQPTAHVRTDSNGMESISSGNSISSSHSTNNESNAKMKKKKKSRPKLQPITSPEKSLTGEEDPEDIFFGDVYAKRDSARVLMDNKHVDCGTSLEKNESSSIESGKKGGNSSEMQEAKGITQMNDYSANLSERVERNTPQLPEAGEVASSSISNIPQDFPGASNPDVEATEMEPMMEADSSANNNNQKRKIDFNQPPETASPESSHSSTTSVSRLSQATIATNDTSATRTTSSETCTPNASNLLSQPHTLGNDHFQEDRGEDANEIDTVELSQPELFEIGDELGEAMQKSRPGEHRANDRYHQSTKPSSLQQRLQTSQNQSQSRQPFHTSQVEQHAELQQQQQQQEQQQQNLQHDQLNSPIDSSDFQTPTKAIRANDTTDSKQSSVAKATQAGSGHTPSRPTSHVPATGEHDKDTIKSTSKRPHPPKPNLKLQPRAVLFSPEKVLDSPDDDGWFAFGFGLVKTPHSDDEEENSKDDAVGDEVGPGGGSFLKKITMDDSTMQSSDGGDGDEKDKGEDDDVDRGISNIGSEMSTPQKSNKERKELVSMEDKFPAANTHQYPALYPSGDDENDESQFESESEIPSRRGSMMSDDLLGEDFNKDDDEDDDEAFDDSGRKEGHCNLTTKDESKGILRASSYKSGSIQPAYPKDELEEYVEKKRQGKNSDDDNERKTPTREVDDLAYSLDQEEPALARETSTRTSQSNLSSISQLSAASFNESALEIDKSANNESAQEKSDTVHLIGGSNPRSSSEEDLNNDDDDDVSFESDSTFAPSDGESSYFSAKRASMERQSHLQPNHYYHHFHPQNFHQHMQHAPRSMSQYGQPLYYYQMQPAQPFSQQLPLNPYSLQMQQQPHRTQRNQGQQPAQYFTPAGNSTLRRPPSRPVNLPLRSNSGPVYASSAYSGGVSRQAVEMKLSLSADDDDEKDGVGTSYDLTETDVTTDERGKELPLFRRSSRGKGDLSCCSSIVESASSDDEVDIALQNHQSTAHLKSGEQWKSATPFSNSSASTDDAGVMNELSAYVSSPGKSEELTTNDDPYNSGRLTPVDGRRVASVLKDDTELSNFNTDTPTPTHAGGARNFYADTQSAMMAASSQISAAKPLAQSDSSYLNQFCGNWNNKSGVGDTGSVGSAVHKSPRGAFKETDRRSPSQLLSSQPITEMPYQSSPRTPKNHHLQLQSSWSGEGRVGGQSSVEPQSLAYSDEDDIDHGRSGVKPSSLQNVLDGAGSDDNAKDAVIDQTQAQDGENKFKVYSSRWIMLIYMSVLNLLSDWTCYSVAPIAVLTSEKFGNDVDPESLVTVFLSANAVASACEPAILGRLGLRRTVVFGALLLMVGSIIKSGGSPLLGQSLGDGDGWRVYLGFFLVGLSQPLYQCTPALLSASWFPENERTMATGIALNSNQLGIGFAFVFGTLLVAKPDDIVPYFQLLSFIATVSFIGCAMQFDDAPPTPPSDTARVIRGTLEIKIPNLPGMFFICGKEDNEERESTSRRSKSSRSSSHHGSRNKRDSSDVNSNEKFKHRRHLSSSERRKSREASGGKGGKKKTKKKKKTSETPRHNEAPTLPSPAIGDEPTVLAMESIESDGNIAEGYGRLRQTSSTERTFDDEPMSYYGSTSNYAPTTPLPMLETPNDRTSDASDGVTNSPFANLHSYYVQPGGMIYQPGIGYYDINEQFFPEKSLPPTEDEGVEPVMTQTPHQLGITVRDDQVWLSFKSCFARKGFAHCVVAFTTSGIVVNTLSTFMDYLVQLQGAERKYVGIVGGTFQLLIMIASMIFGSWTDKSRKYYFAIMALLVLGAFMLSVCSVDLDGDRGGDLRWNLLAVGVLAGPLQPLSTELGVEVVYPLSENTVLVIQQLFSNLLSAAFIPVFKMLRDVGTKSDDLDSNAHMFEVPQYTFSFYMLVVIHALATIYFASFNGSYLRFEEENRKKREKERKRFDLEAKRQRPRFRFPYGRAPVIDENFPFLIPQNYGMV